MPPGNGMISVSMAAVICRIKLFLSAMAVFRTARIACWSGASSSVGELWQYTGRSHGKLFTKLNEEAMRNGSKTASRKKMANSGNIIEKKVQKW